MSEVLVVEDESVLRLTFEQFLEEEGHGVSPAETYDEAVALLDEKDFDVVLTDIILPGKTGVDLLRTVHDRGLDCPVIMITGDPNVQTASEAVRLGAFDYLAKPVTGLALKRVVRLALDHQELARERDHFAARVGQYQRELETIFNSVSEGIITVDTDMHVRQINQAARLLFQLPAGDIHNRLFDDLLPAPLRPARNALSNTLDTQVGARDIRLEISLGDESEKVLVMNTSPLIDGNGIHEGAVLVIRDLTRMTRLEQQIKDSTEYRNIIGKSAKMLDIYQLIEDLAETDSTVLVCGESGTGKELVAEALHNTSMRAKGPFVKVNCAALSDDILESELFGHVKGAFTGAVRDRAGRFESADGGTILLDEIADISARLQLRLLRVLQEREFERVGDSRSIRADVRVIAVSNQDLTKKIRDGEFRQDLYYRLNVIRIEIPPLRARREDTPALVDHFCRRFNAIFKKEISGVAPETMDIFMHYPWLGNVRELENCIERAFIVCRGPVILPEHLPPEIASGDSAPGLDEVLRTPHSRENMSKDHLLGVLRQTDWNVAKSARILGVARNTLYQKIKLYGLSRDPH